MEELFDVRIVDIDAPPYGYGSCASEAVLASSVVKQLYVQ